MAGRSRDPTIRVVPQPQRGRGTRRSRSPYEEEKRAEIEYEAQRKLGNGKDFKFQLPGIDHAFGDHQPLK